MRFIIFSLLAICIGCSPVYIPNSRSVPLFEGAGEVSIDGYINGSGFDLNTGVAVSDHVAIIANGAYAKKDDPDSEDYQSHKYGEIGIGYFSDTGTNLRTEVFGGYGLGEATSVDQYIFFTSNEERTTGYYNRIFFQGNMGWSPGNFQLGGAFRFSHVTFTEFETTSLSYTKSKSATFAEPAFFLKGGDDIKFNLQAGFNWPMHDNIAFDYRFLHVTFGIGAKIGGKKKKEVTD